MNARTWVCILLCFLLSMSIMSCGSGGGSSTDGSSSSSTTDAGDDDDTSSWIDTDYTVSDLVESNTFDYTVDIDFSANTAKLSSGSAQTITSEGVTLLTSGNTSISVAKTSCGITLTSTVEAEVKYNLSGTLSGTFTVSSGTAYQLYLNGVTITATAGPALDLESAQKVFIVTASGTTNSLTDTASRSGDMTQKAALYGKGPMILSGDGTLSITGKYKDSVANTDYIHIRGGTLNVSTSVKDAVHTVNGFIFDDGTLTINATGTTLGDPGMGIKVVGDDDTTNGAGKGYIVINGGTVSITSVAKAMTAHWDIDEDRGDNNSGNPDPYVEINGGTITITTTGTYYDYTSSGTEYKCVPEGIEGKSRVTITGGNIVINANEDAINAGDAITISGGYVYARSSGSDVDGIDSNGSVTISGGVVVAIAPNGGTCNSIDDGSYLAITGGTVVGIGGVVTTSLNTHPGYCTQNVVVLGSGYVSTTSGSAVAVKNGSGTTVFAYTIPQTFSTMVISSPDIATGTLYTVYGGGSMTSYDTDFHGLYLGSLDYSGGSSTTTFTASSTVTKKGGTYF